jgi:nucleotide-binding universal stress UspA family protein
MDMIVMGARGIKGIKSFLIGSVTKSVAGHSSVPVYIAKPPVCNPNERFRILFAADGSEYSASVGRYLAMAPFPADTEIYVLNVIWSDFSDIPERFVMEINDRIKEAVAEARSTEFRESEKILDQACVPLRKKYGNINTLSKVGDPSIEIIKAADVLGVNVIAVGCRGLSGIKGMMGSVSRNILTHSKCSVLISKTCT